MEYGIVLALHLFGAFVTAIVGAYSASVLWRKDSAWYGRCAVALGIVAAYEILTGTALMMLSAELSTQMVCRNIAIYLTIVVAIQIVLAAKMHTKPIVTILARAVSPIASVLPFLIAAVAYGF